MNDYKIKTENGVKVIKAGSRQEAREIAFGTKTNANIQMTAPKSSVNPTNPTDNVITSTGLQKNQQPFNVKTGATESQASNLSESIKAGADTFTQSLQDKATKAEGTKNTALEDYLSSVIGQKGQTEMTADTYSKTVDPLESELVDINNQIMAEQNATRRKLADLDKNPQGLFGGALQDEKNRVERESLAKQADLSVIQMARQGKYDSAKAIADRAVSVRLEQQKNELDALKLNYEENKDIFDKTEQRAFDSLYADRKRKLDKEEADLKEISDLSLEALKEGAPASVATQMRSAKTVEEAMKIGGKYIGSFDRQLKSLQIQKLKSELATNSDAGDLVKINGKDYIRYKDGTISEPVLPEASDTAVVVSRLDNKLSTLDKLLNPSVGLATSAGTLRGAPVPFLFKGKINDWRADAINVVQKLTVDELGRVKSDGVTFGALSNGERQAVGDAATALGAASRRDKEGNPTGKFKMSEKKVIQEFQKIYDGYALDFERRTGIKYSDYKNNPEVVKQKIADDFIDMTTGSIINNTIYGGYPTN
jgi:hypothetical protein